MAKVSEDPPSPVDAYATPVTATPVGDPREASAAPGSESQTGYYGNLGAPGTPVTPVGQIAQPVSKPFDDWTVFAIVALVASGIGFTVPGIVMGHIALRKIKQTGQAGRGFAIAALIVGYVLFVLTVAAVVAWIGFSIWVANIGSGFGSFGDLG
jgi:Domain of unknown function (DUF4190)